MKGDADSVRDAFVGLADAFQRHDLESALNLCTEDVVFLGSGGGEEAVGRDAIRPMFAALASVVEDPFEWSLTWSSVDVDVLGDVALVLAWGTAKLVTAHRNDTFSYRLTGVLVRVEDDWRWRVYHGSEPGGW